LSDSIRSNEQTFDTPVTAAIPLTRGQTSNASRSNQNHAMGGQSSISIFSGGSFSGDLSSMRDDRDNDLRRNYSTVTDCRFLKPILPLVELGRTSFDGEKDYKGQQKKYQDQLEREERNNGTHIEDLNMRDQLAYNYGNRSVKVVAHLPHPYIMPYYPAEHTRVKFKVFIRNINDVDTSNQSFFADIWVCLYTCKYASATNAFQLAYKHVLSLSLPTPFTDTLITTILRYRMTILTLATAVVHHLP